MTLITTPRSIGMAWMAIERDQNGQEHPVPFGYSPAPVVPGPTLDMDMAIYVWAASQYGVPPSQAMLLLAGSSACREVFLRRSEHWREFQAAVWRRHPDVGRRGELAMAAVESLPADCSNRNTKPTLPEVALGWELLHCVPIGMPIVRHNPLPGQSGGNARRADFCIRHGCEAGQVLTIEMCGMLDPAGDPVTMDGVRYLARRADRLRAYERAGLPPPLMITCGELAGPERRAAVAARVLEALRLQSS